MMTSRKFLVPVVVSAALVLAGCGGGGSDAPAAPDISQSASALVAFMKDLIAGTNETSEPIDINGLTLVQDDRSEPSPL